MDFPPATATEASQERVADRITPESCVVFLTGAGVSAESGVPTFRGEDGIWNNFRPEELANFDSFLRNPARVQSWYRHRSEIVTSVQPNAGHIAIADLQWKVNACVVITQNVDNLHQRAGSETVIELHGSILRNYCIECGEPYHGDFNQKDSSVITCPCGGTVRPDVVWFGETLPENTFRAAEEQTGQSDIFLVVGTSGVVYPAAGLVHLAKESGAFLVEVNIQPTELTPLMDVSLFGKSGEILPGIVERLEA